MSILRDVSTYVKYIVYHEIKWELCVIPYSFNDTYLYVICFLKVS